MLHGKDNLIVLNPAHNKLFVLFDENLLKQINKNYKNILYLSIRKRNFYILKNLYLE